MFENMKLGTKLIGSYLIIALIAAFIGLYSNYQMNKLDDADTFLYEKATLPIVYMSVVTKNFEQMAANVGYMALEKKLDFIKLIDESIKEADAPLKDYKKTLIDANGARIGACAVATDAALLDEMAQVLHLGAWATVLVGPARERRRDRCGRPASA